MIASPTFTGDPKSAAPSAQRQRHEYQHDRIRDPRRHAVNFIIARRRLSPTTHSKRPRIFETTSTQPCRTKANIASPALTGTPTSTTAANADASTRIATCEFVKNVVTVSGGGNVSNSGTPVTGQLAVWTSANIIEGRAPTAAGVAPLANPVFTGDVQIPTAAPGDNDVTAANTAFVKAAIDAAVAAAIASQFVTGDMKPSASQAPAPGWILMDDGTIGDATSGATTRANADCLALFTTLWTENATNYAVTPSRGVSAAADWAAHKRIAIPKTRSRVIGGATSGVGGAGLTQRVNGALVGEESHQLTVAELASHGHTVNIQVTHTEQSTARAITSRYRIQGKHIKRSTVVRRRMSFVGAAPSMRRSRHGLQMLIPVPSASRPTARARRPTSCSRACLFTGT